MNMQIRANFRSAALHKEIAKKLRENPRLWEVPKNNLKRWKENRGRLWSASQEWENILTNKSSEEILAVLEGDSEDCIRLRSSSPFTGILSEEERLKIFEAYSKLPDLFDEN